MGGVWNILGQNIIIEVSQFFFVNNYIQRAKQQLVSQNNDDKKHHTMSIGLKFASA